MKKNQFWIIIGSLFLVVIVVYVIFVSNLRDEVVREETSKNKAVKDLENAKSQAISSQLASDEERKTIEKGESIVKQKLKEIEDYLIDIQKDFHYIKGDKDWKYIPEQTIQYNTWYYNKRDELMDMLKGSGFVFELEGKTELTEQDIHRAKEKIGFKNWGTEQPSEAELMEVQQQLAFFTVLIEALSKVFKDQKNVYPVLQKVGFDSWMQRDATNPLVKKSNVVVRLDCPYSYINLVINQLEKSKIQIKVESQEVLKKLNAKEYSEFPNVTVILNLSFLVINIKKAGAQ